MTARVPSPISPIEKDESMSSPPYYRDSLISSLSFLFQIYHRRKITVRMNESDRPIQLGKKAEVAIPTTHKDVTKDLLP